MALTLTPKLTLTGSAADFGNALSLAVTDTLNVKAPQAGLSKIIANANGGTKVTPDLTGGGNKYVYIRHTGKQADGSTSTTNT